MDNSGAMAEPLLPILASAASRHVPTGVPNLFPVPSTRHQQGKRATLALLWCCCLLRHSLENGHQKHVLCFICSHFTTVEILPHAGPILASTGALHIILMYSQFKLLGSKTQHIYIIRGVKQGI